jgi:Histidine kinase-, DNA gyrase B-, and HSP90-like ATPase
MATKQFRTNIPELITRLSSSLYNDPFIALRELLQNANDACILAEGLYGAGKGKISVRLDLAKRLLEVTDTGIGMTEEDLDKFLSTIAATRKKDLRAQLERNRFAEARGIAGSFGIGFLSTFIIAEEVRVQTRELRERGPGSLWRSTGDGNYEIEQSSKNLDRGTTVSLTVKSEFGTVFDPKKVSEVLHRHCPYIRTPYFINNSALPLNHEAPPWFSINDPTIAESFLQNAYGFRGLIHFYLNFDGPVTIREGKHRGKVVQRVRVDGFFAVPSRTIFGQEDLRVYTSGLYVGAIGRAMPGWAKFLVGGIECPDLDLTLGRDNLMDDAPWAAVRQIVRDKLTDQIVGSLADNRSRVRDKWEAIFRLHKENILTAAVEDAAQRGRWGREPDDEVQPAGHQFFNAVKDLIPFRIGDELMSLRTAINSGRCLEKDGKKYLFYHSHGTRRHESAGIQETILFDEAGLAFINAKNYYERDFLQHYSKSGSELSLVPVEEGLQHILDFKCDPGDSTLVEQVYDSLGISGKLCSFKPDEVAAVIIAVSDQRRRPDEIDPSTPQGRTKLIELITSETQSNVARPYTLCVNEKNTLVRELIDYANKHGVDSHLKYGFRQIYFTAVLVFGDTSTDMIASMAPGIANLMLGFLRRTKEQEEELARVRTLLGERESKLDVLESDLAEQRKISREPNSVFIAYGYDRDTVELVNPFKEMLVEAGVKVIDGKVDRVGSLSKLILERLRSCSMFVGILTARDKIEHQEKAITSTWVIEEKGAALAMGLPVLLIVDRGVSERFFGNMEGDAVRLEVEDRPAAWLETFNTAVKMIKKSQPV